MKNVKLTSLLAKKTYLQSLTLRWDRSIRDTNTARGVNEELLDVLRPHQNLKELTIYNFGGFMIPTWVSSLTNLTEVQIADCVRCRYIPSFDQLPLLKNLSLSGFGGLEHIYYIPSSSTTFFPSLKTLFLWDCPNIRECWSREGATTQMAELPSFPCLSKLYIDGCPKLTSMPLYPSVEELNLMRTSLKPLQQTIMLMNTATSTSSKLKSLTIGHIDVSQSPSLEGMRNLSSLVDLCIMRGLSSQLCQSITHLTSVENLRIKYCKDGELDLLKDENEKLWQGFKSLRSLSFWYVPKLESLPKGLQHVTTLQSIHLLSCTNLMALPEWICNLTSLLDLQVISCYKLTSLPQLGMQLQSMEIENCFQLSQRCRNSIAVDWPKIAHIPNIKIDDNGFNRRECINYNIWESDALSFNCGR